MAEKNTEIPPKKKRKVAIKKSSKINSNHETLVDSTNNATSSQTEKIDENLYSRQLYVLGHDAMRLLAKSDVLISGLGGLGVEIAKNVILSGVKSVTLHDEDVCSEFDFSSQFYLSPTDTGKNRAEACHQKLSNLNSYVQTDTYTGSLDENFVKKFCVVVLTNSTLMEQFRISEITHVNNIALIIADTRGVFAQVFCDFGKKFTVLDANGEAPVSAIIANISKDSDSIVTCLDDSRHGLVDGDYVTFSEVQGMVELNNCKPKIVKVLGPYTFSIGDTSSYSAYSHGGLVKQVKMPIRLHFKPLNVSINIPDYTITDSSKKNNPKQLHIAYQTLHKFILAKGREPNPWDNDDANEFVDLAKSFADSDSEDDEQLDIGLLKKFSYTCSGNICPINSFIGGIVAQEVMKACSGKFNPIFQWLYYDAIECLPEYVTEEECQTAGSRTDGQTVVFGTEFQKNLGSLNYFVVGAGAIGCELLKNFAMMGIGTNGGSIVVTDMDYIEKSNLNRQFLFNVHDVQKAKSTTATRAIRKMNQNVNIIAHQNKVGPETENIYNDDFFENLDGVANALDNVEARLYIDQRCIYHRKPLLESGTLGTKGNTQVIVPFLTETYSSSFDPPDKDIPICTLKHFPNSIEHTLQWARDNFDGLFKKSAENAVQYLADRNYLERISRLTTNQVIEILESIKTLLVDERPGSFFDCVSWARNYWEEEYSNKILQLLHNFPPDHLMENGILFWSGPKRCPEPLKFDVSNALHLDYIVAAANLKAKMYGIHENTNRVEIAKMVRKIKVPEFMVTSGISININDNESSRENDQEKIDKLKTLIPPREKVTSNISFKITSIEFEKDDDTNFHMDFIVAASNLRAINYKIPPADRHHSKLIAGKIIPAIATTTSVVAGLVCLELIKLVQRSTLDKYKNGFVNLALPFFDFSEPIAAPKQKYHDTEFTLWDRFDIRGEMTLNEFINYFKEKLKLDIAVITYGVATIYSFNMPPSKMKRRSSLPISEIVREVTRKELKPHVQALTFEIHCVDADENDVEVPYVRYTLPFRHRQSLNENIKIKD